MRPGITQVQAAALLGRSRQWFAKLENGRPANYSDAFLDDVRQTLALTREEWAVVKLATGHLAARSAEHAGDLPSPKVPTALRRFVEGVEPFAAHINDFRWDVLVYNKHMARTHPWVEHNENVMVWALTYAEARHRLINWEQDWALPMLAQLKLHDEQWGATDRRMREVVARVRADRRIRELWDSPHVPSLQHPPGDGQRRLRMPGYGNREFTISLLPMSPAGEDELRFMAVVPADDA